ncbi:MAG TPA: DUF6510 family protein [Galbitalea sp.]|jgi:hypothetical protein
MAHVDGNVLAGPLSEIFSADMTTAMGRCAGCGDVSPLAMAMVYLKPNAFVARCHLCDTMLLTLIQASDTNRLDLSGLAALSIPR